MPKIEKPIMNVKAKAFTTWTLSFITFEKGRNCTNKGVSSITADFLAVGFVLLENIKLNYDHMNFTFKTHVNKKLIDKMNKM